jgi:hypothetical protein
LLSRSNRCYCSPPAETIFSSGNIEKGYPRFGFFHLTAVQDRFFDLYFGRFTRGINWASAGHLQEVYLGLRFLFFQPIDHALPLEPILAATVCDFVLQFAIGQGKAHVPADRKLDDFRFELSPSEKTANSGCQEHRPSLSGQASKLATLSTRGEKG